jgi:hypothetical protein
MCDFMKMASLFSSSEYIDSVLVCGEASGCSASLESLVVLLVGLHEGLGIFDPK